MAILLPILLIVPVFGAAFCFAVPALLAQQRESTLPVADRGAPGKGFTHAMGDIVTIAAPKLGALVNRVRHCGDIAPWTFGTGALMANLARRGLLTPTVRHKPS